MFTNRNRHGLLPEIDFKLTIMMTLLGIKNLSNNAHLIFCPHLLSLERHRVEIFSLPVGGVSQL
ncbi:hypothetical protein CEH67_02700 [Salmonella enterica]|nr:hypothetical protein [Salmonella enterica]EBK3141929.1 hypothetical protein [Salmonella enterica]